MSSSAALDGRRARGDRTRRAVLDHAVQVASVRGLDALSLGGLAAAAPVNKSGIAGLFGSKEKLQLAAVERAWEVYAAAVVEPARAAPAGLPRLLALVESWIAYSRGRVFEGGCFFRTVSVEFDGREGPVRDAIVAAQRDWDAYLRHHVDVAVADGGLPADTDPDQVVFEVTAMLEGANDRSLLYGDDRVYERAQRGIRAVLGQP